MKLKTWCDAQLGRQAALATHLSKTLNRSISKSAVSQAVTGVIPVPVDWYRPIIDFSGGMVGFDDLVPAPADKQEA